MPAPSRDHIINEIRRLASDNKGRAPGVLAFEAATGIKESEWRGVLWVRWGDAIKEAGLPPNAMQGAYSDEDLLRPLALLTRKLGRFPVHSEVVHAAKTDAAFPSATTFYRFGKGRADIARALAEFCGQHDDLRELTTLCISNTARGAGRKDDAGDEESEDFGFVYLLKSGKHYKIGRSNSAGRREREIQLQLPERAERVHTISTDDPPGIEAYWHRRFSDRRLNGEWFELTAADVKAFKRRKFM